VFEVNMLPSDQQALHSISPFEPVCCILNPLVGASVPIGECLARRSAERVLREERYLEQKFGEPYRAYKSSVPRYGWRF
jgi:hypothetical protein